MVHDMTLLSPIIRLPSAQVETLAQLAHSLLHRVAIL